MFPPDHLLEPFALSPIGHAFAFVFGALFGSLANVCIYRWPPTDDHPRGRSIIHPGSHCPACGHAIRWHDNVPILGWLLLRGRCRDCKSGIAPRYPLVELLMGVLFLVAYHHVMVTAFAHEPLATRALRFAILASFELVLVVIAFIDIDHTLILDKITYPAIPLFYGLGILLPEQRWHVGLIGIAVGYGTIRLIADGYRWLTGREGMGYGDAKLLALIGALLGWQGVAASLFLGSLSGSILGIGAVLAARHAQRRPHAVPADDAAPDATRAEPAADAPAADAPAADVPLRHAELPIGPFLVLGAIAYLYTQPWLHLGFAW
jgi:leader peptidase (prepilin peptidase)/N-methyltransferase